VVTDQEEFPEAWFNLDAHQL